MSIPYSENIETLALCPLCESQNASIYIEDRYPIEKCDDCEILFVNPRPSSASIRRMFINEYIDNTKRFEEHFISYRKASLTREASAIKNLLPDGGKLLDVGTASGEFLEHFKDADEWDIQGLEPSKFAAQLARKRTGVVVNTGFLDEQDYANEEFDVISSLDAFCLHSYPNKDLADIHRMLKCGGLFVVEIPGLTFRLLKNTGFLAHLIYKKASSLNAGVHLFYFNRKTLTALMIRHGFKLIKAHPEQSPLYGNVFVKFFNSLYYHLSKLIYNTTHGNINLAPKELLIYKKVE